MGLLSKLFGSKDNAATVKRAIDQKSYADAYYLAEELEVKPLEDNEAQTIARLKAEAGDGLARLNLIEARSKLQNNEQELAEQHFDLALQYVSNPALKIEIEESRRVPFEIVEQDNDASMTGCASCAEDVTITSHGSEQYGIDETTRLELILASYPPPLKKRYQDRGRLFVEAFLASQEGENVHSCELFNKVNEAERDDIYWFEVGSLLARMGQMAEARDALTQALERDPGMMLAVEALVEVLLSLEQADVAVEMIQHKMAERAEAVPQCRALLVAVYARLDDWKAAAENVHLALDGGYRDPSFISLAAMVMEKYGDLDQAETLYAQLPVGGGCRGTTNLQLAEFYLRNNRNLEKAFAGFNAAAKQEPDNPRWTLRLAQTCFARQLTKDGQQLLAQLMANPTLAPELKVQVQHLVAQYGSANPKP